MVQHLTGLLDAKVAITLEEAEIPLRCAGQRGPHSDRELPDAEVRELLIREELTGGARTVKPPDRGPVHLDEEFLSEASNGLHFCVRIAQLFGVPAAPFRVPCVF